MPKSTFFASVADFCLILAFPTPLRLALGLPLSALWAPLAALGVPLGLPKGALGPLGPLLGGARESSLPWSSDITNLAYNIKANDCCDQQPRWLLLVSRSTR